MRGRKGTMNTHCQHVAEHTLNQVVRPNRFILPCPFCGEMPKYMLIGGIWECVNPNCYLMARVAGYEASLEQWNRRYDSLSEICKRVEAKSNPKVSVSTPGEHHEQN
jgi:hypothetical protein